MISESKVRVSLSFAKSGLTLVTEKRAITAFTVQRSDKTVTSCMTCGRYANDIIMMQYAIVLLYNDHKEEMSPINTTNKT